MIQKDTKAITTISYAILFLVALGTIVAIVIMTPNDTPISASNFLSISRIKFTEEFTSQDGTISFRYPKNWTVYENSEQNFIGLSSPQRQDQIDQEIPMPWSISISYGRINMNHVNLEDWLSQESTKDELYCVPPEDDITFETIITKLSYKFYITEGEGGECVLIVPYVFTDYSDIRYKIILPFEEKDLQNFLETWQFL